MRFILQVFLFNVFSKEKNLKRELSKEQLDKNNLSIFQIKKNGFR